VFDNLQSIADLHLACGSEVRMHGALLNNIGFEILTLVDGRDVGALRLVS
jgi:hypothetical protein